MPFIISHTLQVTNKNGNITELTSYYQYSLTGNHLHGGNCFSGIESAKKFESKVKAKRIASEMQRMRKKEIYTVIEI